MKKVLKIGIFQLDSSYEKFDENFKFIENSLRKNKLDLFVVSELFNTGYVLSKVNKRAENYKNILGRIKKLTKKCNVATAFGSLAKRENNQVYNVSLFVDQGKVIKKYKKIHLFTLTGEQNYFSAGNKIKHFDFKGWRFGFSICYDLRFPELYRKLRMDDAEVVLIPANWPKVRIKHWLNLVKARAVENQFYTVGINRIGKDDNIKFAGNSCVFSPWGEEILNMKSKKEFKIIKISKKQIKSSRNKLNSFQDRRVDLY